MALQWTDKVNGVDIIDSGDVNSLAQGIIALDELIADTKAETDTKITELDTSLTGYVDTKTASIPDIENDIDTLSASVEALVTETEDLSLNKADILTLATETSKIQSISDGSNMRFVSANMYGGTTSVANPIIRIFGKNLLKYEVASGGTYATIDGDTITINNTSASEIYPSISVNLPSNNYTLSFNGYSSGTGVFCYVQSASNDYSHGVTFSTTPTDKVIQINKAVLRLMFVVPAGKTLTLSKIQIEAGPSKTDFEFYVEPQTVTIPYTFTDGDVLTMENGTVEMKYVGGSTDDITETAHGQALLALHTNYPNTTVICDTNCDITYKADSTNAYHNLENKLTQVIIALGGTV